MIRKKGLSAVVGTMALVLLTFAAVVLIAGYVVPLVGNSLEESTECQNYLDYFTFDESFAYNCYSVSGDERLYAVSVRAASASPRVSENIDGFRIAFIEGGESRVVDVDSNSVSGSSVGEVRRLNASLPLEVPGAGEIRTYVYTSDREFDRAEIYPKLASERICERSDSIRVAVLCEQPVDI